MAYSLKFGPSTLTTGSIPVPKLFVTGTYTATSDTDLTTSYASHISTQLVLTSTSDVKIVWSPSRIREESSGQALAYFSCSAPAVADSREWYLAKNIHDYVAQTAGSQWIFPAVPSGTHTFYLMVKKINGNVKMNRVVAVDGFAFDARDVLYVETINR